MNYVGATVCDCVTHSKVRQSQFCSVPQIRFDTFPPGLLAEGTHRKRAGQLIA